MYRFVLLLALLLVIVAGLPAVAADYKLAPDDVIEINVWKEPELSRKQILINAEGNITVPYINNVIKAAGYTQQELAELISAEYIKADILVEPKIEINLANRHKMVVWVFGQVSRPGEMTFKEGDTLTAVIAQAGYSPDAQFNVAYLTRKSGTSVDDKPIKIDLRKLYNDGDLSQNYVLQEGDVIYIPEDTVNRYYVLGSVLKPNVYFLKENETVLSAVSLAGGPTERGSLKDCLLVRGDTKNPEKRVINLAKVMKGDISQDVKLLPGDVVYIPETNKPNWSKISQILNTLVSVGYIRRNGIF